MHCQNYVFLYCVFLAGNVECLVALIDAGADIECLDVKAQTPLFVALVNQHWDCAKVLLNAGADPNGSQSNLCSPLSIMCQRGFYPGVKVDLIDERCKNDLS